MKSSGTKGLQVAPKKTVWERIRRDKVLLLFFLPCFIWMLVFCYAPMGGLVIAFKDYKLSKGIWGSKWVGMKFFEQFLSSPRSMNVFRNTICISIIKLGFGFFIPIIFAMLLNEVKNRPLLKITQTVSYMPHFLSWSICTLLFTQLLSPDGGALMTLGSKIFGYEPSNLFANPRATWPLSFFTEIWKETGWNSIIYLAALSGIPAELYEAAELDGATGSYIFFHIKLRYLSPTVLFVTILSIINSFKIFREIYLLTGDYPYDGLYMLQHFMNNMFNSADYQRLSAAAVLLAIVIVILIALLFFVENIFGKDVEG